MRTCECGCAEHVEGKTRNGPRRFVSGHNLRLVERKSDAHRAAISEGMRRAWRTKRKRLPVGTRRVGHDGYVIVKVLPGKGPWIKEHVLVMEKALGRKLNPGELVHHIDRNRENNSLENLHLCRDRSYHNKIHGSLRDALLRLLKAGLMRFEAGRYEAVLPG